MVRRAVSLSLMATLALPPFLGAATPGAGEPAAEVSPTAWLNGRPNMSWKSLAGRLVVVENWSTT
jgi:hypothetical protein